MSRNIPLELNEHRELPVPIEWRETISMIVDRFANGDFELKDQVEGVITVLPSDAARIKRNLTAYGDTLVPLPAEAWTTSICHATKGGWAVTVDLYVSKQGLSDLAMFIFVAKSQSGYLFEVQDIHVP